MYKKIVLLTVLTGSSIGLHAQIDLSLADLAVMGGISVPLTVIAAAIDNKSLINENGSRFFKEVASVNAALMGGFCFGYTTLKSIHGRYGRRAKYSAFRDKSFFPEIVGHAVVNSALYGAAFASIPLAAAYIIDYKLGVTRDSQYIEHTFAEYKERLLQICVPAMWLGAFCGSL